MQRMRRATANKVNEGKRERREEELDWKMKNLELEPDIVNGMEFGTE